MSNIQHHNQIDIFHRYTPFRLDFLFCFVSHSPISIFRCIEAKIKATSWHDHNLDLDSWSLQGKTSINSMHWWFWSIFHKPLQWVRSRCSFLWWVPEPELKSNSYRAFWFLIHESGDLVYIVKNLIVLFPMKVLVKEKPLHWLEQP